MGPFPTPLSQYPIHAPFELVGPSAPVLLKVYVWLLVKPPGFTCILNGGNLIMRGKG